MPTTPLAVAVLTGAGGKFCAGADLKAMQEPGAPRASRVEPDGDGPVGPTRMLLRKPVIAAVEGHAVAGGLELAVWCDLRVAAEDAVFGVYCRRWGIPLMDGGTIRLARLIGHSHALDLILTGRGVSGDEALRMGLANRLVAPGQALPEALGWRTRSRPVRRRRCAATGCRHTSSGRWRSTTRSRTSTATGWRRSGPARCWTGSPATPRARGGRGRRNAARGPPRWEALRAARCRRYLTRPMVWPSGSVNSAISISGSDILWGPIVRVPPRLSAFASAASTSGTST